MLQPDASSPTNLAEFDVVAKYAYENVGLVLGAGKLAMLRSRLRHRLEKLEMAGVAEYFQYAYDTNSREEHRHIVAALTTNVSSFFRERHHFDLLDSMVWPRIRNSQKRGAHVRIWSAGCSHGQEPFSIAMSMRDFFPRIDVQAMKVIASDVDQIALQRAAIGEYDESSLKDLPENVKRRHFDFIKVSGIDCLRTKPALRNLVEFRQSNLIQDRPIQQCYDVVFCRNVMIYFDRPTREIVLANLVRALKTGGHLFIGHAERAEHEELTALGGTVYRRDS
ncbi:MAG: protein-glutamate O-methyltransferase CheR [Pseudomonadota bacterium]